MNQLITAPKPNYAHDANKYHLEVIERLRDAIFAAKNAGDALIAAKCSAGHGNWTRWLKVNFHPSPETARVYMRIARNWELIEKAAMKNPHLSLESARAVLRKETAKDAVYPLIAMKSSMCVKELVRTFNDWLTNHVPPEIIQAIYYHFPQILDSIACHIHEKLGIELEYPPLEPWEFGPQRPWPTHDSWHSEEDDDKGWIDWEVDEVPIETKQNGH